LDFWLENKPSGNPELQLDGSTDFASIALIFFVKPES
jgi:hypothetical protein